MNHSDPESHNEKEKPSPDNSGMPTKPVGTDASGDVLNATSKGQLS